MTITRAILSAAAVCLTSATALADLEPWKDFTPSESVSNVTTVKVDSNMITKYLEGLRETWVASNEVAKELGQIEDYAIFVSQLPSSGEFNVVLVIEMASAADMQPNQDDYNAFMQKWGEERNQRSTQIAQNEYPNMRVITGEYLMRRIDIK